MRGHTKTLRGRQPLSLITNKQFYQAPQACPALPYPLFGRVLATDPAATAALWARVRAMPAETRAKGKKDNDRGKGGLGRRGGGRHCSKKRKLNVPQGDESEELGEDPEILTVVDTIETKLTKITSRNPHFQSLVLRPPQDRRRDQR
jgi:hypothetical protein